MNSYSLLAAV